MSSRKQKFGKRFQAFREARKLDKKKLAESLGYSSVATITLFESGESFPSPQTLIDLADLYKLDLHELLTGEPAPSIQAEVNALRKLKHEVRLVLGDIAPAMNSFGAIKKKLQVVQTELNQAIQTNSRKDTKDESSRSNENSDAGTAGSQE